MNNYYPLAESHAQDAIVIVWPHIHSDWSNSLVNITNSYLVIAKTISEIQPLIIVHYDAVHKNLIQKLCKDYACNMHSISFIEIKSNDTWIRDYGPQFITNGNNFKFIKLEFNAWGEKYPYELDNQFSYKLYHKEDFRNYELISTSFVVEGGNLDFNTQHTLLTNLACIKKNNLNKSYSDSKLIDELTNIFKLKDIIGINTSSLAGDDTGGHIDTLARFVNDKTIVYAYTNDANNPNYECLKELSNQLKQHKKYKLVPIELPKTCLYGDNKDILPASYINFIFANESLLIPLYNDVNDQKTLGVFNELCPERKIIGINACELIKQSGSLHCATLHLPKNIFNESWNRSTK